MLFCGCKIIKKIAYLQNPVHILNKSYLHTCQKTEEKVQHLSVMVNALHEAYLGTKELMNNGTNTYLEVLKAQEDLLTAQLREVENHNDGVQALINLYIALGGAVG